MAHAHKTNREKPEQTQTNTILYKHIQFHMSYKITWTHLMGIVVKR
jgi:hypothetical protein